MPAATAVLKMFITMLGVVIWPKQRHQAWLRGCAGEGEAEREKGTRSKGKSGEKLAQLRGEGNAYLGGHDDDN